jgi:hypothetical protein
VGVLRHVDPHVFPVCAAPIAYHILIAETGLPVAWSPALRAPSQSTLAALRTKYRTLLSLRTAAGPVPGHELRPRLAELARAFPGALRELDQLPLALIEARLSAIESVLECSAELELWMRLQIAYHGFMRAVLRIRRDLRRQTALDPDNPFGQIAYTPAEDEPPADRFDLAALRIIQKPPQGRLNPWVLEQVARDCGVSVATVQESLFLR